VHPFSWREEHCASTEWRRRREAGARERRGACRGEILTRTQINALSDIKTHLGGLDDRESLLFLNTDE